LGDSLFLFFKFFGNLIFYLLRAKLFYFCAQYDGGAANALNSERGQSLNRTTPTISRAGNVPQLLESKLKERLSPSTKYWPGAKSKFSLPLVETEAGI
jgi:hypothetical protein